MPDKSTVGQVCITNMVMSNMGADIKRNTTTCISMHGNTLDSNRQNFFFNLHNIKQTCAVWFYFGEQDQ